MKEILDRIFDSLPLTMAFVVVSCTAFMSLIIILFNRGKGPQLREDMFAPGPGQQDAPGARPTRQRLPQWAGATGFLLLSAGIGGLIAAYNGIGLDKKACAAAALAGFLVMFGYDFAMNGAINRMNYFKVALKYFSLAVLAAACLGLLSAYAGGSLPMGLASLAAGYLGGLGYFYGARFHQNLDAVEMGRRFGFEPAKSGLFAGDWIYDSTGTLNGVQTLFNIEVSSHPRGKYRPPLYKHRLELLCYCDNPYGVRLRVRNRWTGLLPTLVSMLRVANLPQAAPPAAWQGTGQFRCNLPELAGNTLAQAKADTAVFSGDFRELWLSGHELKAVFERENAAWREGEVRRVLEAASLLAAAFNKP